MNEMQVFQSQQFGEVRVIEEDGKVLFCGNDVAKGVGLQQPARCDFPSLQGRRETRHMGTDRNEG